MKTKLDDSQPRAERDPDRAGGDLVKRLRDALRYPNARIRLEAADEIERLQGAALYRAFKAMRKDRDKCLERAEAAEAQIKRHQVEWEQAITKAEAAEARAENLVRLLKSAKAEVTRANDQLKQLGTMYHDIKGKHAQCGDWRRHCLKAEAEAAKLREALEKIAEETAATWVSDRARQALQEISDG